MPFIYGPSAAVASIREETEAVTSGARRSVILFAGDSTTVGQGSGPSGTQGLNEAHNYSPTARLAELLNTADVPARADAYFGHQQSGVAYSAYNPDVVPGADWVFNTIGGTLGGIVHRCPSGTTPETFTPQRAADRFDIYYTTFNGGGTFTVTDASGTLITIDTNSGGNQGFLKATVSRGLASTDTISIQRNDTGGAINIVGVSPWNSTLAEICILNAAQIGTTAQTWAAGSLPYSYVNAIKYLDADLVYAELGLNDKNSGRTIEQYIADLEVVLDGALTVSKTIVAISAPATSGSGYDFTSDWRSAVRASATERSILCMDHHGSFGSREVDTSLYYDAVHLAAAGSLKKAQLMANLLLA